jgi:hypothetical protein
MSSFVLREESPKTDPLASRIASFNLASSTVEPFGYNFTHLKLFRSCYNALFRAEVAN